MSQVKNSNQVKRAFTEQMPNGAYHNSKTFKLLIAEIKSSHSSFIPLP